MTPEQREALATVLAHYGSDPRVRPLRALRDQDDEIQRLQSLADDTKDELDAVREAYAAAKLDGQRLDWMAHQHLEELSMHLVIDAQHDGQYYVCGDSNKPGYGPTLRAAIDAAMAASGDLLPPNVRANRETTR